MCDLWRQTTLESVPPGAIPRQIEFALSLVPGAPGVKLYNAGSFFDPGAIPEVDLPRIAELLRSRERLIVECHPKLVGPKVTRFAKSLGTVRLEVALGLETAHPPTLERLNKGMTLEDFSEAVGFLRSAEVDVRAFVLVRPPFLDETEAAYWAAESARFAFDAGATVVSLIPTRLGNGALDALAAEGRFSEPGLGLVEEAMDRALGLGRGRVFCDLWDLERFGKSAPGFAERRARLESMNRAQRVLPRIPG
jgi:radical SAM enzyme (TIGR01210 family)